VPSLLAPPRSLTILHVEDSRENCILVRKILESVGHRVAEAHDGDEGVRLAHELQPDLVLMDLYLPGMDGYAATARLKESPSLAGVPVIAITASVLSGDRERCLRAGCVGYIKKPLVVHTFADEVWDYYTGKRDTMETVAVRDTAPTWSVGHVPAGSTAPAHETVGLPLGVLVNWLDAVEMSEAAVFGYEEGHGHRTAQYARQVGERLGLDRSTLDALARGCRLHDLGKVQAEVRFRSEGGYLTTEAWNAFATHPRHGADLLAGVPGLGEEVSIILHHHERWDGKGYPDGLRRDEIPLLAQICCVAESFDAMVIRKAYRPEPMTVEMAAMELKRCAGAQFSPHVVEAFVSLIDEGRVSVPIPARL
jgi:response regulator RpfG family c-di-GMP phosphodiesterase